MACGEPTGWVSNTGGTLYIQQGNASWDTASASYSVGVKEPNGMALYKVYLINIETRNIIEDNIIARNQMDAFLKAFIEEEITEIDKWDKHVQFICNLTEEDDD